MAKFKTARFKQLLNELSQEPRIKAALATLNEKSKLGQHVKALKDFLPFVSKLSRFAKGKRAALLAEHLSLIILLFELSILLKQNVFDRPEVQRFFSENWGVLRNKVAAMYLFCSNQVRDQLNKRRRAQ